MAKYVIEIPDDGIVDYPWGYHCAMRKGNQVAFIGKLDDFEKYEEPNLEAIEKEIREKIQREECYRFLDNETFAGGGVDRWKAVGCAFLKWLGSDEGDKLKSTDDVYYFLDKNCYNKDKVEKDVWDFVGEFVCMPDYRVSEIYDVFTNPIEIIKNVPYKDAKTKYDKWKSEHEDIRVDDEIISDDGVKAVVININQWGDWRCLNSDGDFAVCTTNKQHWKKTGRHFDAVEKLLEQMK